MHHPLLFIGCYHRDKTNPPIRKKSMACRTPNFARNCFMTFMTCLARDMIRVPRWHSVVIFESTSASIMMTYRGVGLGPTIISNSKACVCGKRKYKMHMKQKDAWTKYTPLYPQHFQNIFHDWIFAFWNRSHWSFSLKFQLIKSHEWFGDNPLPKSNIRYFV